LNPLKKIQSGVFARMLNPIIDRVNALSKVRGGSGVNVRVGPAGVAIYGDGSTSTAGTAIKKAKCTEDAPLSDHITCNIIKDDGYEAESGEDGYNVEVYCFLSNATQLSKVSRRLETGDYLACVKLPHPDGDRYYALEGFQAVQICT
jgi:hypothetical protein